MFSKFPDFPSTEKVKITKMIKRMFSIIFLNYFYCSVENGQIIKTIKIIRIFKMIKTIEVVKILKMSRLWPFSNE